MAHQAKGEYALAVLRHLAKRGPLNKFHLCKDIARDLDVSKNTVLYAVLDLEKRGEIKVDHSEPARGRDRSSNYYELSLYGLITLISRLDPGKEAGLFDNLAEKYRDLLPRVFDLWPCFKASERSRMARVRLQGNAENATSRIAVIKDQHPHLDLDRLTNTIITEMADDFWDLGRGPIWIWYANYPPEESWDKVLTMDKLLQERAMDVVLKRATSEVAVRSRHLETLGGEGLVALPKGQLEGLKHLRSELDDMKLKMELLEQATGYSIRAQEARSSDKGGA